MYEDKIEKEPKIKDFFKNVDLKLLAFKMNEFYSMITGGPST